MTPDDWQLLVDEYNFSGKVSRTQLQEAAKYSEELEDISKQVADDHIPTAVDGNVLTVASLRTDDPSKALAFRVIG